MFARSTDGGLTFSAPHRINDDPVIPNKWHWFGTFSVAPNGRLDAVWYDTRNAANNTDSQLFYSYSTDAGVTWSPNVAVSNSFNPFEGYPNQNKIGDYITMVSDNTGGNVAYSATFNFNPNGDSTKKTSITSAYLHGGKGPPPTPTARPTSTASDTYGNANADSNPNSHADSNTDTNGDSHRPPRHQGLLLLQGVFAHAKRTPTLRPQDQDRTLEVSHPWLIRACFFFFFFFFFLIFWLPTDIRNYPTTRLLNGAA